MINMQATNTRIDDDPMFMDGNWLRHSDSSKIALVHRCSILIETAVAMDIQFLGFVSAVESRLSVRA